MDLQKGYKPISDSENNLSEISDELNAKTIVEGVNEASSREAYSNNNLGAKLR